MTILDNTIKALKNLGGKASYSDIYAEYEKVVKERDELKAQLNKISGDKFSAMEADELKAYATEHGIDLGNATSKEGIIKKIKASNAE